LVKAGTNCGVYVGAAAALAVVKIALEQRAKHQDFILGIKDRILKVEVINGRRQALMWKRSHL